MHQRPAPLTLGHTSARPRCGPGNVSRDAGVKGRVGAATRAAAVALGALVAAAGSSAAAADLAPLPSTSRQGGQGIYQTEAADGHREGAFTLSVGEDIFAHKGMLVVGDSELFYRTRLNLVWDPLNHLQVMLGGSFSTNVYSYIGTLTRTQLGNPSLAVKGYLPLGDKWKVGASLGTLLPTSQTNAAFVPSASTTQLSLLGTYLPSSLWQVSLNLSGIYDLSRKLVEGDLAAEQRLALNIYDGHHLIWALGAQRWLKLLPTVQTAVFVEGTQDTPLDIGQALGPVRLGGGLRALVGRRARLEMLLAGDARVGPDISPVGPQPASPPWRAFAQLALHLDYGHGTTNVFNIEATKAAPLLMTSKLACAWDADCAVGRTCQEGECLLPPRVETVERPPTPPKTYVVVGTVQDVETHAPVSDAYVELKGFRETRLAVDGRAGSFRTWQLPMEDDAELTAFANGYLPTRVRVRPFEGRRQIKVSFSMRPDPQARPVIVRGLLRDRIWGTPVHGTAIVVKQNRNIKADRTGTFEFSLPGGRHEIVLVAPGYVTQRKQLAGVAGEVVIFNVDMEPFANHRQMP